MTGPVAWDRLPDGWEAVQIRRVASIGNGSDYKDVEVADGGYPVYGSGGEFRRASAYLYDGESVLFGRKGTIDRPLHVRGKFWTVDTMFYTELTPRVHGRFLYYYATTMPFSYYSTSTALPSMTQGDLAGHTMPLPPMAEQQAIADFLDEQTSRIDTLIDKQTQLITTLRERRSVTVEAEIPAGPLAPLRSKASLIQTGPFGSQISAGSYVDGGTPVINPSHIGPRGITPDAAVSVDEALARELSRHALQPGDVVLARRGELGRCAVVTATEAGYICGTGSLMVRLRPDAADPDFIQLVIASGRARHYLESTSVGSTMNNLNASIIGDLRVPALSLAEQKSLVAKVRESTSRIDLVIRKAEQHIVLAKERRSALITAAVTGQIDVRTAGRASQEVA